ncbi:hypothetical protein [Haladaptatus cibarius]|uniref:hypothetical protein n=1 Tax=Haladaptatus cibarius TaxID=453847 RepID=UPI0006789C74|nr:hypothetical protein [Haladaptatus cibarius]
MDWNFLARNVGRYTILLGGGTVAVGYVLPPSIRGYVLLAAVATGMLLLGRAASGGDGAGVIRSGTPAGAATALGSAGSNDVFDPPNRDHAGAWSVFYGIGLLLFGMSTLLVIA